MWSLVIYGMLVFASASPSGVPSNQISEKAIQHFKQSYREASGERWTAGTDCYRVSFEKKSIKHIVDYNLNGRWRNTIRIYDESNLPGDLQQTIKTAFIDSKIIIVNELNYRKNLSYFIKIRHEGWLKTIQLTNGNMAVVEEFKEQ